MKNGYKVINDILRGNKPERVGFNDGPWPETIANWVEDGYPTRKVHKLPGERKWRRTDGKWEEVETEGEYEEPVPLWKGLVYDIARLGGWFDIMPRRGYSEVVEDTDEWEIRRNGAGAALKYWKYKSGTPEHIDFLMTEREVWEKDYKPHLLEWDEKRLENMDDVQDKLKEAKKAGKFTLASQLFIWELMRQSMGDVTMYESLIQDPEWIHDFNRVYTDFYKRYFRYIFDNICLPDGIRLCEDLGYKNGLFASPGILEDLIFPYYNEIVEFFHNYDLPVVLHTCGSVAEALPLIVDAGFDALHPMERKAKDNEPFIFAKKYEDKLAFLGGLDVRVFETNNKKYIREEMTSYINGMKESGARLVFGSDHSVPPSVDYETYRYIIDVYQQLMWY